MMRTLLFLTLGCIFGTCFGQVQDCPLGPHSLTRFGPSCEYLCHCGRNQCDRNTGECHDGVECDRGWMGPGCQYNNIAYNGSARINSTANASVFVDGLKSTCANVSKGTTLTIDFQHYVNITEVHVLFSNAVPSFNVSALGPNSTNTCNMVHDTQEHGEIIATCEHPLYGWSIQINWQGPSALCEIQVPAGRNMAYGKPALQSSMHEYYYANRSVDGDATTGNFTLADGTCSHTKESDDPWWILDLETTVIIQWFRIYNRKNEQGVTENLQNRLKNFRILISEDKSSFTEIYQDQSTNLSLVTEVNLHASVTARFVKIDLNGTGRILVLCEVQVFGECLTLSYGNCSTSCGHCADGRQCNRVTGYCDKGGCADGWQTVKCDKTCNDTYYGNCTTMCGHCRNPGNCDKVNGSCSFGQCSEGWRGEKCDTECSVTYYGHNCESKCGHCLNGTCDRFTGNCSKDAGCQLGWHGFKCDTACDDGYYGNCTTRCGNCRGLAACDKIDGSCQSSLCYEGWHGEKCNTICDSTHYGQNCVHECGRCLNVSCDRITGNCTEASGCQPGWHGSRCDLGSAEKHGSNNPTEPSILGGSIGAALVVIGIIIVIVIVVKRRNMDTTKKETITNQMEINSVYINLAAGNVDTPAQQTAKANLDKSKTYYNIVESSAEITLNTNSGIMPSNYYEKLGDRKVIEESSYSTIEHIDMDTDGRTTTDITSDCDEQLKSLDIELRNVE